MDADEAARLEHIRRWVRPDFERWLRPDWERHVHPSGHEAMQCHIAECKRAFETPRMRAARLRDEEEALDRKRREDEWDAACAARKLRSDLAWERFKAAMARVLSQKAGYNPDQPRDDHGRWADSGQGANEDDGGTQPTTSATSSNSARHDGTRILSDAEPDNVFKPGAQLAQDDTARRSPVDLREEDGRGGHTIEKHVSRPPQALIAQTMENFDQNPNARNSRSGSFSSLESANKLVNSTLAQNGAIVDQVASGVRPRDIVFAKFDSVTGIEAVMPNIRSQPYFQQTYSVGAVIYHDPSSPRGYTVLTAFPSSGR